MTGQHWPERWTKEIPRSRVDIIPGVKHFTFEDAPDATVENFRQWWKTIHLGVEDQALSNYYRSCIRGGYCALGRAAFDYFPVAT